jgi:osmoprotectant transport system permease protein
MGYTEPQVLRQIELPLASPVMLAGVRIAFIQVLATTAIGAIVTNGGGLGRYVVDGFARGVSARPMVLAGAIMLAGLTLLADAAFNLVERAVVPAGVRDEARLADVANRAGAAG